MEDVTGGPTNYAGTLSGDKVMLRDGSDDSLTAILKHSGNQGSPDLSSVSPGVSATFTKSDGTTGVIDTGYEPFTTTAVGTESGTITSTSGDNATLSVQVGAGQISGTATRADGTSYLVIGTVIQSGFTYLAYQNSAGYETSIGSVDLGSSSTLSETPSGQTVTLTLTADSTPQAVKSNLVSDPKR